MQRKRFYATQLMKLCFQALLYASLFVSFFGMLSITNEAILNISRTAGTTIATFVLTMLLLSVVYGGYEIGVKKMRSVFASISLATFFTDLITYVMLQIMNTNPNNPDANPSFTFWGEDLALLFGAFILQLLMIYLFVALGYRYYFRINPPLDCCIVASSQELAEHVASKMATFRQRYRLTDVVHYECPDVKQTIQDHDVVFLAGIPDTEEALLEAYCYKHNKTIYLVAELEDVVISTAQQNILDDAALSVHPPHGAYPYADVSQARVRHRHQHGRAGADQSRDAGHRHRAQSQRQRVGAVPAGSRHHQWAHLSDHQVPHHVSGKPRGGKLSFRPQG